MAAQGRARPPLAAPLGLLVVVVMIALACSSANAMDARRLLSRDRALAQADACPCAAAAAASSSTPCPCARKQEWVSSDSSTTLANPGSLSPSGGSSAAQQQQQQQQAPESGVSKEEAIKRGDMQYLVEKHLQQAIDKYTKPAFEYMSDVAETEFKIGEHQREQNERMEKIRSKLHDQVFRHMDAVDGKYKDKLWENHSKVEEAFNKRVADITSRGWVAIGQEQEEKRTDELGEIKDHLSQKAGADAIAEQVKRDKEARKQRQDAAKEQDEKAAAKEKELNNEEDKKAEKVDALNRKVAEAQKDRQQQEAELDKLENSYSSTEQQWKKQQGSRAKKFKAEEEARKKELTKDEEEEKQAWDGEYDRKKQNEEDSKAAVKTDMARAAKEEERVKADIKTKAESDIRNEEAREQKEKELHASQAVTDVKAEQTKKQEAAVKFTEREKRLAVEEEKHKESLPAKERSLDKVRAENSVKQRKLAESQNKDEASKKAQKIVKMEQERKAAAKKKFDVYIAEKKQAEQAEKAMKEKQAAQGQATQLNIEQTQKQRVVKDLHEEEKKEQQEKVKAEEQSKEAEAEADAKRKAEQAQKIKDEQQQKKETEERKKKEVAEADEKAKKAEAAEKKKKEEEKKKADEEMAKEEQQKEEAAKQKSEEEDKRRKKQEEDDKAEQKAKEEDQKQQEEALKLQQKEQQEKKTEEERQKRLDNAQLKVLRESVFRPGKGVVIAPADLIQANEAYSYMFWIRPTETPGDSYVDVFDKAENAKSHSPAAYLGPKNLRLTIVSGTNKNPNQFLRPKKELTLNAWTHVAFTHGDGHAEVLFNGSVVLRLTLDDPLTNSAALTAESQFGGYAPASCDLADFRFYNSTVKAPVVDRAVRDRLVNVRSRLLRAAEFSPYKGLVLATSESMPKSNAVSFTFWMRLNQVIQSGLANVMDKASSAGDHQFGVWMRQSTMVLQSGGVSLEAELALGKWTHIAFVHEEGRASLFVNGDEVSIKKDASPPTFNTANLLGDSKYGGFKAALVTVSDVNYYNGLASVASIKRDVQAGRASVRQFLVHETTFRPTRGLVLAQASDIPPAKAITWAFWIRFDKIQKQMSVIADKGLTQRSHNPGFYVPGGTTRIIFYSGHGNASADSASDFIYMKEPAALSKWTHVAFTHEDGYMKTYVNGHLDTTKQAGPPNSNDRDLVGFDRFTNVDLADAAVSDLRYFTGALTEGEIEGIVREAHYGLESVVLRESIFSPVPNQQIAPAASFKPAKSVTYTFWVRPTGSNTARAVVFHRSPATPANDTDVGFVVLASKGLSPRLEFVDGKTFSPTPRLPMNTWTHVAFIHRPNGAIVLYNSTTVLSTTTSGHLAAEYPLMSASAALGAPMAKMQVADLRYFNGAVSKRQIAVVQLEGRHEAARLSPPAGKDFKPIRGLVLMSKLPVTTSYSIMFWINPLDKQDTWSIVFDRSASRQAHGPGCFINPGTTRLALFSGTKDAPTKYLNPSQELQLNRWTHVAMTHAKGALTVYYNGQVVASQPVSEPMAINAPLMADSRYTDGYLSARVRVRSLQYFTGAVSSGEVLNVYREKDYQ